MASRAQITDALPEILPGDFVEWDEASPASQSTESGGSESGPGVDSKPATQAANGAGSPSGNPHRGTAMSISALENTGIAAIPDPARSLRPPLLSSREIVVLVAVLAIAMIPVLFHRALDTFDGYGVSLGTASSAPSAAPALAITTARQPEDAIAARAGSRLTVPTSTAATTTGKVQISSDALRPIPTNPSPSRKQAQRMDDQLHAPTRLQLKAGLAEQPPGGIVAADVDGSDNIKAIQGVFGSPKQPSEQIASQQVIRVPSAVALGLLIHKTQPIYPLIAKESQVSGTIVLATTISKTGIVENLSVVSGPVMFRMSAVNAVRTWRFKPYILSNHPTAIETTISVHFCGQADPCELDRQ